MIALIPPPDIPGATFFNYNDRSSQPGKDDDCSKAGIEKVADQLK